MAPSAPPPRAWDVTTAGVRLHRDCSSLRELSLHYANDLCQDSPEITEPRGICLTASPFPSSSRLKTDTVGQCTVSGLDKPGEQRRTAQDGCNGCTLIPSVCMVCPAAALKAKLCLPTPLERECFSSRGPLGITSIWRIPTVGPRCSESFTLTDKAGAVLREGGI